MARPTPINEEIILDPKRYIVSKTDEHGVITFGNPYFVQISGYSERDLLGAPHNIIRHPDMPKIIFKMMWDRISEGKNMIAIVKNMAKDGRFYWVMTDFEPKIDPTTKKIISHTAYRKAPPREAIEKIEDLYKELLKAEERGDMAESERVFNEFLAKRGQNYDQFIDEITENQNAVKGFFTMMKKVFG